MAKLTKEQVERWSAKLQNGFAFDVFCYMRDGDKQITKKIELEDGKILEATITYREPKGSYAKVLHPTLHLQLWEPANTPGMMCSHGIGAYIGIGNEQAKRNYNELVRLSGEITSEKISEYAKANISGLEKETIL